MIYIIVALVSEAKPLIAYYKLQRVKDVDFYLYANKDILLCVSGVGYTNALKSTKQFLKYKKFTQDDILINIGLCASPSIYKIGELLIIDEISYKKEDTCSLDINFKHSFNQHKLLSVSEPQMQETKYLVDMEGYAILMESLRFLEKKQLLFIKIVSDYFQPETLTKNLAYGLINKQIRNIDLLIKGAKDANSSCNWS